MRTLNGKWWQDKAVRVGNWYGRSRALPLGLAVVMFAITGRACEAQSCVPALVEYKSASADHYKAGWPGNVQRTPPHFYLTQKVEYTDSEDIPGHYSYSDQLTIITTVKKLDYTFTFCEDGDGFGCPQCVQGLTESQSQSGNITETSIDCGYSCSSAINNDGSDNCPQKTVSQQNCMDTWQDTFDTYGSWIGVDHADSELVHEEEEQVDDPGGRRTGTNDTKVTLSNEYKTSDFIKDLGEKVRSSLDAVDSWTSLGSSASLDMGAEEHCATGTAIKYRFKLPSTESRVRYKLRWQEVTRYIDGTIDSKDKSEELSGTGDVAYSSEHTALPPEKNGSTAIEEVTVSISSQSGEGSAPGSPGSARFGGSSSQTASGPTQGAALAGGFGGARSLSSCASCGGSGDAAVFNGLSFAVSMGTAPLGDSAGEIELSRTQPSPTLSTPHALAYSTSRSDVQTFTSDGDLRQISAPQATADIVTLDPFSYEIRYYYPSQISGTAADGTFLFTGSPFITWKVENPDRSETIYNRLRFTETEGITTRVYEYSSSGLTWTLTSPDSLRIDEISVSYPGNGVRLHTDVVKSSNGVEVYRATRQYQTFTLASGQSFEGLVQETVGSGSAQRTTTYTYYTSGVANGTALPLQQVVYPTGYWERYEYDAEGKTTKKVAQFLNAAPGAADNLSRVTTYDYTTASISGSGDDGTLNTWTPRMTVESLLGQEISRSYNVIKPGERDEIHCQTAGAAWNAADNLVTVRKYFTSGTFINELQSIKNPDGTMSIYDYALDATGTQRTNTVSTGQPDGIGASIVNGTRTVTVIGDVGQIVSIVTTDISSGIITSQDIYTPTDALKRSYRVTHPGGTTEDVNYGCCGIETTVDRDGTVTFYNYDSLRRLVSTVQNGITMLNTLDAVGNVLETTRVGATGSSARQKTSTYNNAGQLTSEVNALDGTTTYAESADHLTMTITYPDLGTRVELYNQDGSLQRISGTAIFPVRYAYGVITESGIPRAYTTEIKRTAAGADTPESTTTYTDAIGRLYKTVFNAASGTPARQSFYNNLGQLWKETDPDGVATLYGYNTKGELEYTAIDVNLNNVIDLAGLDRVTQTTSDVIANYGTNVRRTRTYVWGTDNSNTPLLVKTAEASTDGLRTWNTTWNAGVGAVSRVETTYNPAAGYRYVTDFLPNNASTVRTYQYGRLISVVQKDSTGAQIGATQYSYDPHGRPLYVTDARTGTTTYGYNAADQVVTVTTPSPAQTTSTDYNNMLQAWQVTYPDGTSTINEFYPTGLLKKTYGSRTFPVQYTYDDQGRLKTMTTWQNYAAGTGAAVTIWNYDSYRGWLANKRYNDGTGPDYSYSPGGRLKTRTWARTGTGGRILTTYSYGIPTDGSSSIHGDLLSVAYSNDPAATPGTTFVYDRRGRQRTVTRNGITTTLAYSDDGQLTSESYSGTGTLNNHSVTSTVDSYLRKYQVTAKYGTTILGATATYGYDNASRLSSVSDGTYSATYGYVANSPLVGQVTFQNGSTVRMTTTKVFDNLNRLQSISSTAPAETGSYVVSSHIYSYNNANQRTGALLKNGSYWTYGYDPLGQVISGKKRFSDGTLVPGEQFEYVEDDIGNRTSTKVGGDSTGANLRSATYVPNTLNEYSSRTVPNAIDVLGIAKTDASVTVNSQTTYRKGEFYQKAITVANGANNSVTVSATSGTTVSKTGTVFVPPATETYTYDLDGNLTSDGRWNYTWDAENRLIRLNGKVAGVQPTQVDYEYDWRGRRIRKTVTGTTTIAAKFLYDGWNVVAELDGSNNLVRSYMWGADLSGPAQRVGGVGALLYIKPGTTGIAHACAYDGYGNVMALVDGSNGSTSAEYEYGAFAEPIRSTGAMASSNPFRFSTKFTDDDSDFTYYGYRYYNQSTGRWASRDPIDETGGLNLYLFVDNCPTRLIDVLGMGTWSIVNKELNLDAPGMSTQAGAFGDPNGFQVTYLPSPGECPSPASIVVFQVVSSGGGFEGFFRGESPHVDTPKNPNPACPVPPAMVPPGDSPNSYVDSPTGPVKTFYITAVAVCRSACRDKVLSTKYFQFSSKNRAVDLTVDPDPSHYRKGIGDWKKKGGIE